MKCCYIGQGNFPGGSLEHGMTVFETQSESQIHWARISWHYWQWNGKIHFGMLLLHSCQFHYHTDFNSVFIVSQVTKVSWGYSTSDSSSLCVESQNPGGENDLKSRRVMIRGWTPSAISLQCSCTVQASMSQTTVDSVSPTLPSPLWRAPSSKGLPAHPCFQLKSVFVVSALYHWFPPPLPLENLPPNNLQSIWGELLVPPKHPVSWFVPSVARFCVSLPISLNLSPWNASYFFGFYSSSSVVSKIRQSIGCDNFPTII